MNFFINVFKLSFLLLILSLTACGEDLSKKATSEEKTNEEVDAVYKFIVSDGILIATSPDGVDTSNLTYQWMMYGEIVSENSTFDTSTYNILYTGEHTVTLITIDGDSTYVVSSIVDFDAESVPSYDFNLSDGILTATPPDNIDDSNLTYQWLMYGEIVSENSTFNTLTSIYSGKQSVTLITSINTDTYVESKLVDFGTESTNQSPIANFSFSNNTLTATSTDDAGSDNLTHTWFVNDQSIGNGTTLDTSSLTGISTIKLISTDTDNLSDSTEQTIDFGTITPVNSAPIAIATSNKTSGDIPLSINFDASNSTDTENNSLSYSWDFGDGTSSSLIRPTKVFSSAGNFTVTLIVTDSENASNTADLITITATSPEVDLPPVARITKSDNSGNSPLTVSFDASASSDDNSITSYNWNFGDGNSTASGLTTSYIYNKEGIYTATLTVTDDAGQSTQATTQITVEAIVDLEPVASFRIGTTTGNAPLATSFNALASSDDNGISSYSWDFGDDSAIASGSITTHTYTKAGVYTATLTVSDGSNQTDSVSQNITVTAITPPTANFVTTTSELNVIVDATSSTTSKGDNLTYSWKFIDEIGTTVNTATGVTATYDFATAGVKSISLMITDSDSLTDESTQTITLAIADSEEPNNGNGTIIFEEDYEDQTAGENPTGWGVNIAYNIQMSPNATTYANKVRVVDDAPGRSGKALYVDGTGLTSSQNYSIMPLDLSVVDNVERVYVRYYMYATTNYIGNRARTPSGAQPNHNHFMSLGLTDKSEMRIGEIKGALGANEYGADDIVPKAEYWYGQKETARMDAGTWYCVETAFINDGDTPVLRTWLDDVLITEIDETSDWKNGAARDNWLDGFFGGVQLGWGNHSTYDNELYFDDVVASNERIGCDASLTEPAPTLTPSFEIDEDAMVVMVDGSDSTGSEDFTYEWDFDGEFIDTRSGSNASYTFTTAGDKTISLTLTSGNTTETITQNIIITDTTYDDLLSQVSVNIVSQTCMSCHSTQFSGRPIVFESFEPADVEIAMTDYITNNSAQNLIDVPNGIGHRGGDQILNTSDEIDWEALVNLIDAKINSGSESGTGSLGNGNIIINDDFEGQTANSVPQGWKTFLSYQIDMSNNKTSNNTFALIDSSMAHSGSNSIRIKTGGNTIQPAFIFQDLPTGYDAFYSRAWMYIPTVLGGGVKGPDSNHAHFMSYSTEMSGSNKEELRYGSIQDGILGAFLPSSIDAGTENIVPTTEIPANEWVCVEFAMIKGNTFDQTIGWVGGDEIFNATSASDWARDPGQFFSSDTEIANHVTFGWRSFGDNKGVENIWFDDIVVSDKYIGCN